MDDESGHVGSGMVDVNDSGGLLLLEILDKAGVELVSLLAYLLARSPVRYGHQQAVFGRHLHAPDDSFQLLSFQTHSLIDAETSGRKTSGGKRGPAGRHRGTLFGRQGVPRQFLVAGNKVHLDEGVVVF